MHSFITGGIKTEIGTKNPDFTYENSKYNVEGVKEFRERARALTYKGTEPEDYVRQVISKINEKKNVFNIYLGSKSFATKILSQGPQWFVEYHIKKILNAFEYYETIKRRIRQINESNGAKSYWWRN